MIDWDLLNRIYSNEFDLYLEKVKEGEFVRDGKNLSLDEYVLEIAKSDLESSTFVRHLKPDCEKDYRKKFYWEFFAKVLIERKESDKEILTYMFYWLKDLNWPGALLVFEYLSELDNDTFLITFEKACRQAIHDKDENWLKNMCRMLSYKEVSLNDLKDKALAKLLSDIAKNI